MEAESISAYDSKNADWDTPFRNVPSCEVGEFSENGNNPFYPDMNAKTFSETRRTGDGEPTTVNG